MNEIYVYIEERVNEMSGDFKRDNFLNWPDKWEDYLYLSSITRTSNVYIYFKIFFCYHLFIS